VTLAVATTTLLIMLARIADVTLGTVRTVAVVNGRKRLAFALGFLETLIWVVAVSKVMTNLSQPMHAVSYAFGFALGNLSGIMLEQSLAYGEQVLRVFTRRGEELAGCLRAQGLPVTVFDGQGKDGPIQLLVVQTERRRMPALTDCVESLDPHCYYVIDDVRKASSQAQRHRRPAASRLTVLRPRPPREHLKASARR